MTQLNNQAVFAIAQPEAVGIPSGAILRFLQALDAHPYRLHAFMLMRHGRLCFSGAAAPYTLNTQHRVFSAGKSILALSALIAMQEGHIKASDFIADYFRDILGNDHRFDAITVDDLLTMRSGQEEDPFPAMLSDLDADLIRLFFTAPPIEAPGTTFRYNNTIPHVVYALVEKATGIPFARYQQEHLLNPLNAPVYAPTNSKGQYNPVVMAMSAVSLMKFAMLYLQEGNWNGEQLIEPKFIQESVKQHTSTGMDGNAAGYGWQIWRNTFGGYRMDGGWGQYAIMMPQEDLTAVILSDMPDSSFALEVFAAEILPHLSQDRLSDDLDAQAKLKDFSANMTLAPKGGHTHSPNEKQWFAKQYCFQNPDYKFTFTSMQDSLQITLIEKNIALQFSCGLNGTWLPNPRHLLVTPEQTIDNGVYGMDRDACFLTAVWRNSNMLEISAKSLGAQGEYVYHFTFSPQGVTLAYPPRPCRGGPTLESAIILTGKGANI